MKNVLITGGTGLVGTRLTEMLLQQGYAVAHLSRKAGTNPQVKTYIWDVAKGEIDPAAVRGADYLIHLAGAGIADGRWTPERKREILESRTHSLALIMKALEQENYLKAFVSSSAIGYYGGDTGTEWISEQYTPGIDFMADVCVAWEAAADQVGSLGIRTVKLRTGIVLSTQGGALPKLAAPIRFGLGAALASGKQYQSWIHLDDLCRMFIRAIEDPSMQGPYNAVAPNPVTNADLTKQVAHVLKKPLWLPNVPAFVLNWVFGEMAIVVTGGAYILNQRIKLETDFRYLFTEVSAALEDLLGKP